VSLRAHIAILLLSAATLVFILRLVRGHRLRAKYSVLWVSLGVVLAVVASAPSLLETFSDAIGVKTPALTFLLMAITFLLVLSLHFSWELSRLEDRTRALGEEIALLRQRVDATELHERTDDDAEDTGDELTLPLGASIPFVAGDDDQRVRDEWGAQTREHARQRQQQGAAEPGQRA
jgi:hypothetical protein